LTASLHSTLFTCAFKHNGDVLSENIYVILISLIADALNVINE
jgi:hypothetical protein